MNHDNPYAAPQTVDQAVPWAEPLPSERGFERQRYPEVSTVELTRLANWSIAIDGMSLVWAVVVCFAALTFVATLWRYPWQWLWGAILVLSVVRLWGDYRRSPNYWAYNLVLDALFLGGFGLALLSLAGLDWLAMLIVGLPLLAFGAIAAFSVLAHLFAKPLYRQFRHRELLQELRYRKQNGIA